MTIQTCVGKTTKLFPFLQDVEMEAWSSKFIVKLGSCSSLLKSLNSTLKVSIQSEKEQSWRYNLTAPTTHPKLFKADIRQIITPYQLNSTLKVSIQSEKEQSWRYNLTAPTTHPPQKLFKADRKGLLLFSAQIVKLGSCSSLLKFLYSTLKVSIGKEQSWRYNLTAPPTTTHHPKLFKADKRQIITPHQLTLIIIRVRSISHLH